MANTLPLVGETPNPKRLKEKILSDFNYKNHLNPKLYCQDYRSLLLNQGSIFQENHLKNLHLDLINFFCFAIYEQRTYEDRIKILFPLLFLSLAEKTIL